MDDLLLTAIELDDDDIYDAWMFCQPDKPVSTYDPNWERFDFNLGISTDWRHSKRRTFRTLMCCTDL